ncbi:hypothetical protein [Streptomyces sp. UG1]|uniref:hypothetical protein n=1 Tax=Streptomyces sp. UG1 TaxID=3417652 RepID=UPI003CEE3C55
MVTITEQQVRQAEVNAVEQERVRDEAARALEANPYSEVAAATHTEESRLAAQLRANARELRAAFEEQVVEERRRASRPELERAAEADIRVAAAAMEEQQRVLVEAVAGAQEALVAVLEAGRTYSALVEGHAKVLEAAGLDVRGGESGGDCSTLNRYRVKVRGRVFEQVDPGALAAWVLHRMVAARLGQSHFVVAALEWVSRSAEQDAAGVLAGVPEPKRAAPSKRLPLRVGGR